MTQALSLLAQKPTQKPTTGYKLNLYKLAMVVGAITAGIASRVFLPTTKHYMKSPPHLNRRLLSPSPSPTSPSPSPSPSPCSNTASMKLLVTNKNANGTQSIDYHVLNSDCIDTYPLNNNKKDLGDAFSKIILDAYNEMGYSADTNDPYDATCPPWKHTMRWAGYTVTLHAPFPLTTAGSKVNVDDATDLLNLIEQKLESSKDMQEALKNCNEAASLAMGLSFGGLAVALIGLVGYCKITSN